MPGWTSGSVIAQAAHGCCSVIHKHKDNPQVIQYLQDLSRMHKVVYSVKNAQQLEAMKKELQSRLVPYEPWVEQPEGIETALVTLPVLKSTVIEFFKRSKVKLWQ